MGGLHFAKKPHIRLHKKHKMLDDPRWRWVCEYGAFSGFGPTAAEAYDACLEKVRKYAVEVSTLDEHSDWQMISMNYFLSDYLGLLLTRHRVEKVALGTLSRTDIVICIHAYLEYQKKGLPS